MKLAAWTILGALVGALLGYLADPSDFEAALGGGIGGIFLVFWLHERGMFKRASAWKVPAVFAFLGLLAIVGWKAWDAHHDEAGFVWRDAAVEARPVQSLKGIRVGESFAAVGARLAGFSPDLGPRPEADSPSRNFVHPEARLRLRVAGERVTRISYECAMALDSTSVNRIGCGARESRVLEVFGNGARRLCGRTAGGDKPAPDAFAFDVLDTGTRYVVLDGAVRGFIVMEPRDLEGALGGDQAWHRCG